MTSTVAELPLPIIRVHDCGQDDHQMNRLYEIAQEVSLCFFSFLVAVFLAHLILLSCQMMKEAKRGDVIVIDENEVFFENRDDEERDYLVVPGLAVTQEDTQEIDSPHEEPVQEEEKEEQVIDLTHADSDEEKEEEEEPKKRRRLCDIHPIKRYLDGFHDMLIVDLKRKVDEMRDVVEEGSGQVEMEDMDELHDITAGFTDIYHEMKDLLRDHYLVTATDRSNILTLVTALERVMEQAPEQVSLPATLLADVKDCFQPAY